MDYRIAKLREYLFGVLDSMMSSTKYQINANMLSNKIDDYSLDKIPTSSEVENWIIGGGIKRDVFSFRSRKPYSQDTINNLANIGFFEEFEATINSNNEEGNLPDIDGIESIKCLSPATMNNAETQTAEFDLQIQITYRDTFDGRHISV